MEEHVERELRVLDAQREERSVADERELGYQRLNVFREVFRMFSNATPTYGPILERVLQEYEAFIRYLETMIESAGKDRRQLWREFEARQVLREEEMHNELAAQQARLSQQKASLERRRKEVEGAMDEIRAELNEYQREVSRMHEQNLTLAHQIVEYRERTSEMERELKASEVWKEKYTKMTRQYEGMDVGASPTQRQPRLEGRKATLALHSTASARTPPSQNLGSAPSSPTIPAPV